MSYKTYTTNALVCGSVHHNTSDRHYLLFCEDAGMLWGSARSVREERSRQRNALQDFSLIRVSLVKGKSGWRIGSAQSFGNIFLRAEKRQERGLANFLVTQLRRYIHGEVPLPRVYNDVMSIIERTDVLEEHALLKQLFLVRLLSELGYIAPQPQWLPVIEAETAVEACAVYTSSMEGAIARAISEGTQASHL